MALEMRAACERCGRPVTPDGVAFICSHECTFCQACTTMVSHLCPNCEGELVRRPRRLDV